GAVLGCMVGNSFEIKTFGVMASDVVPFYRTQHRILAATAVGRVRAPRMKGAAGGAMGRVSDFTAQPLTLPGARRARVGAWDGRQQGGGIGMGWMREQLVGRWVLADPAGIHHSDTVGDV